MRFYAHKIANVDTIEDADLLNHLWGLVLKNGIHLDGSETLLYMIDTRGDVFVFVDPVPMTAQQCRIKIVPNNLSGTCTEICPQGTDRFEIQMPGYYILMISEYRAMINVSDDLTDEQINNLGIKSLKNDYAALRKDFEKNNDSGKKSEWDDIIKVTDIPDAELKNQCIAYIERNGWTPERSYLIKKSNDDKYYMCMIPVKNRIYID